MVADRPDIEDAVNLGCFDRSGDQITPEPVRAEPTWLNSQRFAVRLLNALTSEHVFLSGDADLYRGDRDRAEKALAWQVLGMRSLATDTTLDQAVQALPAGPAANTARTSWGTRRPHTCARRCTPG
ncbi:hypothetical protein [Nocardia sp. NPDC004123]